MNPVIEWLESPVGEKWSSRHHQPVHGCETLMDVPEWLRTREGIEWSQSHHDMLRYCVWAWEKTEYDNDWSRAARWPEPFCADDLDDP